MTGLLDDGTAGLMVVSAAGGEAIVQDPESALFAEMPKSAIKHVGKARRARLEEIPSQLLQLVNCPLSGGTPGSLEEGRNAKKETLIAELNMHEIANEDRRGQPSPFACTECGGVLWEIEQEGFLRFRCRVGHALTAKSLRWEQKQAVETALWEALRALEESASLYRRMAGRANGSGHTLNAQTYEDRSANTEANAKVLRDFLLRVNTEEGQELEGAPAEPEAPPVAKETQHNR